MSKTETQHTPGPWTVKLVHGTRYVEAPGNEWPNNPIVRVDPYHWDDEANARLIAAAPLLLEALEAILAEGAYDDDGDFYLAHRPGKRPADDYLDPKPIEQARHAISAARGGEA